MPARKIDRVKKRDGRIVAYDEAKIAETIARAAQAAGQDHRTIGTDLAGVVTMYLERYYDKDVPSSEEIRRMVEKILFETGHTEIARAFMLSQEDEKPRETPPTPDLFPTDLVLVDGATRDEVSTWGRARISAALEKEAGLERATADEIAVAVEAHIFRLGQRRVSTSLIRELVNHELFARGFSAKVRKQIVVGLPKYDLGLLFGGEPSAAQSIDPEAMCRTIGETTMRQYALQEIFSRDVSDAHLEGRIHVHGIEAPLKLWWLAPSIEYVKRYGIKAPGFPALEEPTRCARTLTAQLGQVAEHAHRFFSGGIEFNNLDVAYAFPEAKEEAAPLLLALSGCAVGINLATDLAGEILEQWRFSGGHPELPDRMISIRTLDDRTLAPAREACRLAAEKGGVLFLFDRGPRRLSRFAAQDDVERWFALAQAVTLNLPQAFYRSDQSDFYAELETSVRVAVRAHLQKRQLLRRFVHGPTRTFGHQLGWTSNGAGALRFDEFGYAIGLAGLNETVKLMTGQEMSEDESALRLALRIVSYLFFRVKEESEKNGIRLTLEDIPVEDACGRFLRVDTQLYPRARGLVEGSPGYTEGHHARMTDRVSPIDHLASEARSHALISSGRAVLPASARTKLSAGDLFALVQRLLTDSAALQLHVR